MQKGRPPRFASDAKIKLLIDKNPHREGSNRFKHWSLYRDGMTVEEAIASGLNYGDLRHGVADKHIAITAADPAPTNN